MLVRTIYPPNMTTRDQAYAAYLNLMDELGDRATEAESFIVGTLAGMQPCAVAQAIAAARAHYLPGPA